MTRRDWHTLAAYATIAAAYVALAALLVTIIVVMLWAVLRHSANADGAPIQPRPTPTVASRSLVRPFLTAPPSDHAAAGRDQTSPSASASAALARRSVATLGPAVDEGKASAAGPSATTSSSSVPTQDKTQNRRSETTSGYLALRARIAWCESRGELTVINPRSGASGKYQFLRSTFLAVTGLPGNAGDYPEAVQDKAFDALFAARGTRPWLASRGCWETR